MRLICPNCEAQYEVDAGMIPVSGRDVQCSNCGKTWFQAHSTGVTVAPADEDPLEPTLPDSPGDGLGADAAAFFAEDSGEVIERALDVRRSRAAPDADAEFDGDEPEAEEVSEPQEAGSEQTGTGEEAATAQEDSVREAEEGKDAETPEEALAPEEDADTEEGADSGDEPLTDDSEQAAELTPLAEGEDPEAEEAEQDTDDEEEELAASDLPHREIDPKVLGILRAEAEREIAARRAEEARGVEMQTDLGLEEPSSRPEPTPVEIRTARLRGGENDADAEDRQRAILPDIEDINATLTATSDRDIPDSPHVVARQVQDRRAGFRFGFTSMMGLVAVVILVYLYAPQIARAIPGLEPALAAYVDWANGVRLAIDGALARSVDALSGQDS